MKTSGLPVKRDAYLFSKALALLTSDLSQPKVESSARKVLNQLRAKGYAVIDFDTQEPECLFCLQMSLQSAADLLWRTRHLH
jgi:predicted GNAT superfamily acetyltransferase